MNRARASRGLRAAEEVHWPARWGLGPGEAARRGRLEQGQPQRSKPARQIYQSPAAKGPVRYVYAKQKRARYTRGLVGRRPVPVRGHPEQPRRGC